MSQNQPQPTIRGQRPAPHARHAPHRAVRQPLAACLWFYKDLLGMRVEWQPDDDNVYLCSGIDNLALHRATGQAEQAQEQSSGRAGLDHFGFIIDDIDDVGYVAPVLAGQRG